MAGFEEEFDRADRIEERIRADERSRYANGVAAKIFAYETELRELWAKLFDVESTLIARSKSINELQAKLEAKGIELAEKVREIYRQNDVLAEAAVKLEKAEAERDELSAQHETLKLGCADAYNALHKENAALNVKLKKTELDHDDLLACAQAWEEEANKERSRADRAEARLKEVEAERDTFEQKSRDTWAAYCGADGQLRASQERERIIDEHRQSAVRQMYAAEARLAAAMKVVDEARKQMLYCAAVTRSALSLAVHTFDASERERASGAKDPSSGAVEGS